MLYLFPGHDETVTIELTAAECAYVADVLGNLGDYDRPQEIRRQFAQLFGDWAAHRVFEKFYRNVRVD